VDLLFGLTVEMRDGFTYANAAKKFGWGRWHF
jgi:hypothetical protein